MMDDADVGYNFNAFGVDDEWKSVCHKMGWNRLSAIQRRLIPQILNSDDEFPEDLICIAPENTGKLSAVILSILMKYKKHFKPSFVCLLTPTSSRATIICNRFKSLGKTLKLKYVLLDDSLKKSNDKLATRDNIQQFMGLELQKPHVIVGTPETVRRHMENIPILFGVQNLKHLVLDRVDRMFDNDDFKVIVDMCSHTRKYLLFPNGPLPPQFEDFQTDYLIPPPIIVELDHADTVELVLPLTHHYVPVMTQDKVACSAYLLDCMAKLSLRTIIFTCQPETVIALQSEFERLNIDGIFAHDFMAKRHVNCAANDFINMKSKLFVCDDKVGHLFGLPVVDVVINYDFAENFTDDLATNIKRRFTKVGTCAKYGQIYTLLTEIETPSFFTAYNKHLSMLVDTPTRFDIQEDKLGLFR